jgi:glycosyltransferase involved in cell wall biosynthesis
MTQLSALHLSLFFSRGTSLEAWRRAGTLARELRLYQELAPHLAGVSLVTYGGRGDLALAGELGGLGLVCNRRGLHPRIYAPLLRWLLPRAWPRPAVFKSNQVQGAEVMLSAAKAARAASVARAGYLPSNIAAWAQGEASPRARGLRRLERRVFRSADRAVLSTPWMAEIARRRYGVPAERVRVIPNYVDTELFRPGEAAPREDRVVYVGRLHREKNLAALVEAAARLELELELIGEGPERGRLEELARRLGVRAGFTGALPNHEIPARLARAAVFAFPSLGEHHPKGLIEAMSAGKAVVACRVAGVRELVEHRVTGWLTGTSAGELAEGLAAVLGDGPLRERLGDSARRHCLENYSLERVAGLELELYRELAP